MDVVVVDGRGRPVPNLKPEDFVLLEDGRPQRVSYFLSGVFDQPPAETAVPERSAPRAAPVELEQAAGRHIVFALDDWHLGPESLIRAKQALKTIVDEQLSENDEAAIVTTSGSMGLLQPFTSEKGTLRWAIDRLAFRQMRPSAPGRATMSEYQAQAIETGDLIALELAIREIEAIQDLPRTADGRPNPRIETEARAQARSLVAQSVAISKTTLRSLEEALSSLDEVPGRKIVVFVSDGFLLGAGTPETMSLDLQRLIDAATRARASVFALQARGLLTYLTGGDASRPSSTVQTMPGVQDRYERLEDRALRDGMGDLAESTGGFLIHSTNDLSAAMKQALDASAASYLLAYEPGPGPPGRFRNIDVKLPGHPQLTVHARRGYFAPGEQAASANVSVAGANADPARARRDSEIRLALLSLVPMRDVPLSASADYLEGPGSEGPRVVIRAHADLRGADFQHVADRDEADLEFVSLVYAQDGTVAVEAEGQRAEMKLSAANRERVVAEGLGYQRSVAVRPGSYQVRVIVRDERSGRLGSAWRRVDVPDLTRGTLVLSDVVLHAEELRAGAGGRASLKDVQARPRYPLGASLYYVAYAYNARRDAAGTTDAVAQAQVWAGDKPQGASSPEPLKFEGRTAPVSGRIALEGLKPGAYELRVLVADRRAQATAQKRVAFAIE